MKAFATHRPTVVVKTGFIDEYLTISVLSPVARIARPRRVLRNTDRKTTVSATAMRATMTLYQPFRNVPDKSAFIFVKTVSVVFRFFSDAPPSTAMFTE